MEDGTPFDQYISSLSAKSLGTDYNPTKPFPLLIKYIDAGDNLSIQVHPDDEYARKVENDNGKDEMWYIVSAKPGALIYIGWKEDTDREEVKKRIESNAIEELLNKIYVKLGDSFFIEAGTVHAIGKGCLVAEIHQSSNVTYRLYDYGRLGGGGKPRELHISKALDVLKYAKYEVPAHASFGLLAMCPTFKVRKHEVWKEYGYCLNTLHSYEFEGPKGMDSMNGIVDAFRVVEGRFCNLPIEKKIDYQKGVDGLPKSNVIKLFLTGGYSLIIRPSGTEPNLKVYISIKSDDKERALSIESRLEKLIKSYFTQGM
ncbi:MAG: hypothetical protein MJ228_01330 [Bacilli bacterium]|nr:hypothetical protein [Bacilli bacterium]